MLQKCCKPCSLFLGIVLLKNSFVGLVQPLQEWARIAGRRASEWEAFNLCEHWNSFKGEGGGVCQLRDNHRWGCKWSRYLILISSCNSDGRTADEMDLYKVCSLASYLRSKGVVEDNCKWIAWKVNIGYQLFMQGCYRRWKLGVLLQPWNQTTVMQMAHHMIPMTKEISDCKVKLVRRAFAFFDSACIIHHESVPGGTTEYCWLLRCYHIYSAKCKENNQKMA